MCQHYVAKALKPAKKQFPNLVIQHIDDILFSAPSILKTQQMFDIAQWCLKDSGLIIAPEKIQIATPYYYLRFVVNRQYITPQLTHIRVNKLSTLNDFQKLLGDINWIRPTLGIANDQLTNLLTTLKGDAYLNSLCLIQNKLQKQFLTRIRLELPRVVYAPFSPFPHGTSCPTRTPDRMDLYPFSRDKVTYALYWFDHSNNYQWEK